MPHYFAESLGKASLYEGLDNNIPVADVVPGNKVADEKMNLPHGNLKDALLALDDYLTEHIFYDKTSSGSTFANTLSYWFDHTVNCGIASNDASDTKAWKLDAKDGAYFKRIKHIAGTPITIDVSSIGSGEDVQLIDGSDRIAFGVSTGTNKTIVTANSYYAELALDYPTITLGATTGKVKAAAGNLKIQVDTTFFDTTGDLFATRDFTLGTMTGSYTLSLQSRVNHKMYPHTAANATMCLEYEYIAASGDRLKTIKITPHDVSDGGAVDYAGVYIGPDYGALGARVGIGNSEEIRLGYLPHTNASVYGLGARVGTPMDIFPDYAQVERIRTSRLGAGQIALCGVNKADELINLFLGANSSAVKIDETMSLVASNDTIYGWVGIKHLTTSELAPLLPADGAVVYNETTSSIGVYYSGAWHWSFISGGVAVGTNLTGLVKNALIQIPTSAFYCVYDDDAISKLTAPKIYELGVWWTYLQTGATYKIKTRFIIPLDYVSGGKFRVSTKDAAASASVLLNGTWTHQAEGLGGFTASGTTETFSSVDITGDDYEIHDFSRSSIYYPGEIGEVSFYLTVNTGVSGNIGINSVSFYYTPTNA